MSLDHTKCVSSLPTINVTPSTQALPSRKPCLSLKLIPSPFHTYVQATGLATEFSPTGLCLHIYIDGGLVRCRRAFVHQNPQPIFSLLFIIEGIVPTTLRALITPAHNEVYLGYAPGLPTSPQRGNSPHRLPHQHAQLRHDNTCTTNRLQFLPEPYSKSKVPTFIGLAATPPWSVTSPTVVVTLFELPAPPWCELTLTSYDIFRNFGGFGCNFGFKPYSNS